MKFLKIAALVAAVLLAAALVAPMLLRGKITQIVKREANEMLNARLDFEKLDISLLRCFPSASVELKGLTLVGVDRFEGDTIVSAKRISVVVDVLSLLRDEGFEVSKVILASASLHAHKLADGAVNWDVMKPSAETPSEPASEPGEPSSFRLSIRDFRIIDAAIRYEDDSTKTRFSAAPVSLRLKGDLTADETDLDLRLEAEGLNLTSGSVPLLRDAEAELKAVVAADLKNNRFTFSRNMLRLNAVTVALDGWVEAQDDALAMDLKAGCEKVQFKDVLSLVPVFYTRDFRTLAASGEMSMSLWARGEMRGSRWPAFELKTQVREGRIQYSSLPKAVTGINIAARVSNPGGGMDLTEVDLSKLSLKMGRNILAATFNATDLVSDPKFLVSAAGRVDLGDIAEVYPLEKGVNLGGIISANVRMAGRLSDIDNERYEQMNAAGTLIVEELGLTVPALPAVYIRRAAATITPQAMTLGEFGVTVGRSDISANGQLSGYLGYLLRGGMLSGRLYVKSDLLDLNEIMAAAPAPQAKEPTSAPTAPLASGPLEVPRNLDLSLNAELRRVLFEKMSIADVVGEMHVGEGAVALDGLGMQLFGGKAAVTGRYSTAADPARPTLQLSLGVDGASFARTFEELELVQRLVPLFAKTGGDYSLALDLATTLDASMSPDMKTLDATGEIKSQNIRLQNIGAFDMLSKSLGEDKMRGVEAKDLAIRFEIRNGRIATQPFDLILGGFDINLSGSTGLDQTIDYAVRVSLPGGVPGGLLDAVNVHIGGTFSDPKITLGAKEAVEGAVKKVIDQQIQKLTGSESLSDEVQKQTERLTAEVQKQVDNLRAEAQKAGEKIVEAARVQRTKLVDGAASKGALAKIAAEKAGDKLVAEAEKQAAKLTAEAEKQIEKLTAKKE